MDSAAVAFARTEQVFRNFRIATMAPAGTTLSALTSNKQDYILSQPDTRYGELEDCSIGVCGGRIQWILPTSSLPILPSDIETTDGEGRWLTPGLIDCHTHLVYGGNRANEWESRLTGVSYEEIARQGGGILSSVKSTRLASIEQLVDDASLRLRRLMEEGVTTVEIKSGYGLDQDNEIKMLEAARELQERHEVAVVTTLLAAHAVPPEFKDKPDEYIDLICEEIIPAAKDKCMAVDAFCESIAFDVDQTKRVFEAAIANGLAFKVHGEQLTSTGISGIAAKMGALSADHLEYLSDADCKVMGETDIVATVLPGAFYCLKETQKPPIDSLRKHGVPIAVATDCNPGSSPVTSLLLMANMACNMFGLTPEESLLAITRNAAQALGLQASVGTFEPGKRADFVVWDVDAPAEIVYGVGHNPCLEVYRAGSRVLNRHAELFQE